MFHWWISDLNPIPACYQCLCCCESSGLDDKCKQYWQSRSRSKIWWFMMDHPKENEWLKIQFTCAVEIQTIYNYYNESLLLKHEHFLIWDMKIEWFYNAQKLKFIRDIHVSVFIDPLIWWLHIVAECTNLEWFATDRSLI